MMATATAVSNVHATATTAMPQKVLRFHREPITIDPNAIAAHTSIAKIRSVSTVARVLNAMSTA